jgi:hypothetical protein
MLVQWRRAVRRLKMLARKISAQTIFGLKIFGHARNLPAIVFAV